MFFDDIALVKEMVAKYGFIAPMADLGGLARPCIADYARTIATGSQRDRYVKLPAGVRPFDEVDPTYTILNPEQGDPIIEELPNKYPESFGTIVCLSVLEHVVNPFDAFNAFHRLLKPSGLLIISTVFSFPKHDAPRDYWRFSDDCLRMLAEGANLMVLECGKRLDIHGGMGVKEIHMGVPQEIRSVYIVARKQGGENE